MLSTTPTIALDAALTRLKDNNFDALRLTFASLVVVFHTAYLSQSSSIAWAKNVSATFAVQAFFVVSGFLVTMSFENSKSLRAYGFKRLRRIAPAYIAIVFLCAVVLATMSTYSVREYFTASGFWRYLTFNLTLSNFSAPDLPGVFQNNYVSAVNGSLWTIKIEAAFYFFVPLMVWACRTFGWGNTLLTLFVFSIAWKAGFSWASAVTGSDLYLRLAKQIPGQLAFFVGGAFAYYRTKHGHNIRWTVAAAGAGAYAFSGHALIFEIVAPAAVSAIVYWSAIAGPRLPKVAKYGDISYGIYLYHFPLIQTVISLGFFNRSATGACSVLLLCICGSAVFSWRFIERPFVQWRANQLNHPVPA